MRYGVDALPHAACRMYVKPLILLGARRQNLFRLRVENFGCAGSRGHSSCGSSYPWVCVYTLRIGVAPAQAHGWWLLRPLTRHRKAGSSQGSTTVAVPRAEALPTVSPGSPVPIIAAYTYLLKGATSPGLHLKNFPRPPSS
jgi:hypothetical protein